jgi:uncharacterized protein (DUF1501 family)
MVAPLADDGYYRARPRIAITAQNAVKLDDFFGFNPLLKELAPAYRDGQLAIVHAVGSEDATRSHFEAQDLMERGGLVAGGWLGRFLRYSQTASGPLSAVAVGKAVPESLRGAPAATVMQSLDDFSLGPNAARLTRELEKLYGVESDLLGGAARDTLEAMRRIEKLRNTVYQPRHGAEYGRDDFSQAMQQVARLLRARIGLQTAAVDMNGWDSHINQGGIMDPLLVKLSAGLSAFYRDFGREMDKVTVVVMTEFGRRLAENSAFGTDHGRGSVMFVLGGGVPGGRVLGNWPGLNPEVLDGPGDLPVTTNYRDVLAPVLQRHSPAVKLDQVFPNHSFAPLETGII